MREYSFLVCSVCDEIVSLNAQCVIKSFPRMLSMRMLYCNFRKLLKYPKLKCKFRQEKIEIFKNRLGTLLAQRSATTTDRMTGRQEYDRMTG
jgi:hypothetical protein